MRYLITSQTQFFASENYTCISIEKSLEMLNKKNLWGLDTETKGFDPYTKPILLVQIGDLEDQFAIDTTTIDIQRYKEFFEEKERLFVLQNAKFDIRFFLHQRIVFLNVFDTYLAEKLLYLGYPPGIIPMGLGHLTDRYLGVYLDKSIRGEIHRGLTDRVIIYGCDDVKYLIPIMEKQLIKLKEQGLEEAIKIENRFVVVLAYVEYCGLKLDPEKWQKKIDSDKAKLEEAKAILDNWVVSYNNSKYIKLNRQGDLFEGFKGPECAINWASSKQVIPLFKELGFNLKVKDKDTGKMKDSIEANVIEAQEDKSPLAPLYLTYSKAQKVVTTYGETFIKAINPVSHRIHTQFNQLMDTTRLSCGGIDKDTGQSNINFQNIPNEEETRHAFVSEEGYTLIDCDYSAQEDLVFTEASREEKLIEFYNDTTRKRDGHSFLAKLCFPNILKDIPEEAVKKFRPDLRRDAKTAKFALHYGGNGTTVARNLSKTPEEGLEIEKAYFRAFPGIDNYFKKIKSISWKQGYVLISEITGHKAYIYDWKDLVAAQSRFNTEFWDQYRKYKPLYTGTDLPESFSLRSRYIKEAFKEFADGEDIEEIAESYKLEVATLYVEFVKHFFNRKGASERMALNYPKMNGTSYSNVC